MKKILSIALALALCLTAMMGCFVVSAAANTLAVGTADITVGDTTANVVVDITSEGVWAIRFDVVSDVALTAVTIDDANFNAELEGTKVLVQSVANDYANNITAAKITLTFATADLAAGSYAVAIENIDAGNYAEAAVAFDTTAGAIDVAEAVVEPAEPVLDESLALTASINITEKINARVIISKEIAGYADYDLVISRKDVVLESGLYNLTDVIDYVYGKETVVTTMSDGRAVHLYNDLGMYELGIDFTIMVKCYDAEGNYVAYSNPVTTNIGKLAYGLYSPANASAKNKNIAIDIAKLGDEAQKYMVNGKDCGLATVTSPISYFPEGATEGAVFNADALDKTNNPQSVVSGVSFTPAVNLSANPALRFLINGTGTTYAQDTLSLDIDYINGKNGSDAGKVVAGADLQIVGTANTAGVRYVQLFDSIALYDTNAIITATLYSGDAKLASVEYSIEAYVAANYNHARMGAVVKAVANLGTSARAYFGM